MVQCPTSKGPSMFLLGCELKDDADSWIEALKQVEYEEGDGTTSPRKLSVSMGAEVSDAPVSARKSNSKTSGGRRGIGSLLLGGDCRVDFPGTPRRTNKQQSFYPFTIFAGNKKLELGGQTFDEAVGWVSVLVNGIERTKHDGSVANIAGGARSGGSGEDGNGNVVRQESVFVESDVDNEELFSTDDPNETLEGMLYKKFVSKDLFKLARGWHTRYFTLNGDRMEYFLTSRSAKPRGVVVLGEDCRVDFQGIPLKRGGREMYCFSVFAENGGEKNAGPFVDGALLLGTPSLEHAETWVNALRRATHSTSNNRTKRSRTVVEDADEEEDNGDDHVLTFSPSVPRMRAKEPLHYGEKIRLWTVSAYADSKSTGDFLGVYLRKKRRFKGTLLALRPAGKSADFPVVTATFTVQDPSNEKHNDNEVCYGDPFVLIDDDGLVMSNCLGYVGPRPQSDGGQLVMTFHRSGGRDGDPVCYRDSEVTLNDWKRKRQFGNFKKGVSKLEGGYLYIGPHSKPISFEIREPGRSTSESGDDIKTGSENASADRSLKFFVVRKTFMGSVQRRLRRWNVEVGEWVNLGATHSDDAVEIEGFLGGEMVETVPPYLPPFATVGYSASLVVRKKPLLLATWKWEGSSRKCGFVNVDMVVEIVWYVVPLIAAFVAMHQGALDVVWLDTKGFSSGLFRVFLYICAVASCCHSIARAIVFAVERFGRKLGNQDGNNNASDVNVWSICVEFCSPRRSSEVSPVRSLLESNLQSEGTSPGQERLFRKSFAEDDDVNQVSPFRIDGNENQSDNGLRTFSETMVHVENGAVATSYKDLPIRSWCNIKADKFILRAGPNYPQNKVKKTSGPAMYHPIGCDLFLSPHKLTSAKGLFQFSKPQQEKMMKAHHSLSSLNDASVVNDVPSVIFFNKGFPNSQPPNPLWGQPVKDGETHVFFQAFVVADWVVEELKNSSSHPGINLWKKFVARSKEDANDNFLDRFKLIQAVANADEIGFGSTSSYLVRTYNAKPLLTRPQHAFNSGSMELTDFPGVTINYMEVFIDVWGWNYLVRQGLFDNLQLGKKMVVDWCVCVEAHEDEEMPEQALMCIRTARVTFDNKEYKWLDV
eukprot:g2107.t1